MLEGGCNCGAIRYHSDQPGVAQAVCHCKNCQRQAGSAFSVLVVARASGFHVEGEPKVYHDKGDSGAAVDRNFCGNCGSPIFTSLPHNPKMVFIKAGTLDDTSILDPKAHVWCDSAWPWTPFPADAVKIARNS